MNPRRKLTLTSKEFERWRQLYYLSQRSERMGQAFCNDHALTNPELYYEEDPREVEALIRLTYVRDLF